MFYQISQGQLAASEQPVASIVPIAAAVATLLPAPVQSAAVSELHHSFYEWGALGLSPGVIVAERVWCNAAGALAFYFHDRRPPQPLTHVGLARELAAWLVLLDKWLDTNVVVAHARARWGVDALGGALSFTTPAFLPLALVAQRPDNWERVARTLAAAIAAAPLTGATHQEQPGNSSRN
jgi:hypothetical protein